MRSSIFACSASTAVGHDVEILSILSVIRSILVVQKNCSLRHVVKQLNILFSLSFSHLVEIVDAKSQLDILMTCTDREREVWKKHLMLLSNWVTTQRNITKGPFVYRGCAG